jgi:predicted dehydrogenase
MYYHRREFLATAASAGVAALGTGLNESRANETSAANKAANKIVVGVMGLGTRGPALIRNIQSQPGVEIAYVCDVDNRKIGKVVEAVEKATGKAPQAVQDYRRILDDGAVDMLIVATCNHWHALATIEACAAGKHVYVEKPCSHTPLEGELMIAAARQHKRYVQMGTQRRSCSHIAEAIDKIHHGLLGHVYLAQSWYTNNRKSTSRGVAAPVPKEFDYELWQGPAPRRPFTNNVHPYNWHWFWHWGNGELGNTGIHYLDLCRWGLEVDYPTQVASTGGRYRYKDDQETPDTNLVAFEFKGDKTATWEGLSCNRFADSRGDRGTLVQFHGEKGSLAISDQDYKVYDPFGKELPEAGGQRSEKEFRAYLDNIIIRHMENLFNAIRGGKPLHAEIEEGHKSTMLCHLGNIAYRVGRSLHCRPQDGQIIDDAEASQLWTREYAQDWEAKFKPGR